MSDSESVPVVSTSNSLQQYETFSGPPKFIMVGKKGPNNTNKFYNAPRDIRPIPSLNYDNTLQNISLIIAALFHKHPQRKPQLDRQGNPVIDTKTKEPKQIVDFDSIKSYVRYFGLVDLDMPLEQVLNGSKPMWEDIPPQPYKNMDALKQQWNQWLKTHSTYTIGEIREYCKPFDAVCRDAQQLAACLAKENKHFLFFFSGCKGFRLLWYDPALFFWVFTSEDYAKAYKTKIATKYFTDLGCDVSFALRLDVSVYDRNKGVKPDVLPHPDSQLFSWLVEDFNTLDEQTLVRFTSDTKLVVQVKHFWTDLPAQCPLKIPHLRLSQPQPVLFEPRALIESDVDNEMDVQQGRSVSSPTTNSNSSSMMSISSSNSSSIGKRRRSCTPEPVSSVVTGDAPTEKDQSGKPSVLSEEIQSALLRFFKEQLKVRKQKFPNAGSMHISVESFPSHHIKRLGDNIVLTIDSWCWCAIAHRDHSELKSGKVYFIINSTWIRQKCHSDHCKTNYYPVYTVEAEKERLAQSNKDAKRLCMIQRRREQEEYEREKQRRFEARSPSPDSRMSVDTKYLPKYTEVEKQEQQQQAPTIIDQEKKSSSTVIEEIIPEPLLVSNPLPWYRQRQFDTRLSCKEFYLDSFLLTKNGVHGTPIYPLVISLEEGFGLDANYVLFSAHRLTSFMQEPQFKKFLLYVVIYDERSKTCGEWGLLKRERLTLKQGGEPTQYVIEKRKCKPCVTCCQSAEFFRATKTVPSLIRVDGKKGGYINHFEEKEEQQWIQEGYIIPENYPESSIQIVSSNVEHNLTITRRVMANVRVLPFYLTDEIQSKLHDNYTELLEQTEQATTEAMQLEE